MNKGVKIFFTATLLLVASLSAGQICRKDTGNSDPVTIEIWNVFDDSQDFGILIDEYKALDENKHVDIVYKKKTLATYEEELLQNLSTPGAGPDIFAIGNEWIPNYKSRIVAMPQDVGTARDFRTTFVDVASTDLILDGRVVGVPTYVDSLALVYNKDLLNSAGIATPPTTWTEFKDDVGRMTSVDDSTGAILQAGSAIGTANNVSNATDILSLLMLQSGSKIVTETGGVEFHQSKVIGDDSVNPGLNALSFYTSFAQSTKESYTWNAREVDDITAFTNGRAAMILAYAYQIPEIQAKAPKLNIGVAEAPQISEGSTKIALAEYWPLVVSANTTANKQLESWKFLNFIATKSQAYSTYLQEAGRPTAKRANVTTQSNDPLYGPYADQALFARSQFLPDITRTDQVYAAMIQSVVLGELLPEEALIQAARKVELLYDEYIKRENTRIQQQSQAAQ